jgi:hypothetical protein
MKLVIIIVCVLELVLFNKFDIWNTKFTSLIVWFKSWSLTLREEREFCTFENKVHREIYVPKRD